MTQNARLLARLRLGPVAAVDFQPPNVCDDGTPIWRVAARIDNLRNRGYVIASDRLSNGTAVYRLISEPDGPVERALSETKDPTRPEQADPGSVPSTEGVRSAAPAEQTNGSLFDATEYGRGDWRDAA